MGKKKKEKERQSPAPVMTGGDFRAVEHSAAQQARTQDVSAPDGVSGRWE